MNCDADSSSLSPSLLPLSFSSVSFLLFLTPLHFCFPHLFLVFFPPSSLLPSMPVYPLFCHAFHFPSPFPLSSFLPLFLYLPFSFIFLSFFLASLVPPSLPLLTLSCFFTLSCLLLLSSPNLFHLNKACDLKSMV